MTIDEAFEQLKRGLEAGRLAHAYIVEGAPRGEGQKLAERVLGLLHCSGREKPCGRCAACRQVKEHQHPDALWIEAQSKSRRIVIEQIRDIQHRMYQTSFSGGWKTCVIMGADRMGPEASNAFLKTLEEPPGSSLFLLLTETPQFLLPTIASRCQYVRVDGGLPREEDWTRQLVEILSGSSGRGGAVATLARSARMLRMLKDMRAAAEAGEKERADAETTDEDKDTLEARASARYRETRAALLRAMLLWYRDILLLNSGAPETRLHYAAQAETLRSKAGGVTYREAMRSVEAVETMSRQMERNLPEGFVLDCGLNRLL